MSKQTKTPSHDRITVLLSFLTASAVEAASLAAMFLTMGHAGPEGPFAAIGWLSTVLNFPGLLGAAIVGVSTEASIVKLAGTIFAFQMPLIWAVIYLVVRFLKYRRRARFGRMP